MVQAQVLHRLLLVLILVGLIASIYAAFEVLNPALQGTCSINSTVSCAAVDASSYSNVGPIPDWSIGLGGFIVLLLLDIPLFRTFDPRFLYAIFGLSAAGVAFAAYFAYLELVFIHAICPVCTTAHLAGVGVFLVSLTLIRKRSSAEDPDETPSPKNKSPGSKNKGSSKAKARRASESSD